MFIDENKLCYKCGEYSIKCVYTFGSHIFIELFAPFSKPQKNSITFDVSLILENIPKRLWLNNKSFILRGAINFIQPISITNDAIGHYISYC